MLGIRSLFTVKMRVNERAQERWAVPLVSLLRQYEVTHMCRLGVMSVFIFTAVRSQTTNLPFKASSPRSARTVMTL